MRSQALFSFFLSVAFLALAPSAQGQEKNLRVPASKTIVNSKYRGHSDLSVFGRRRNYDKSERYQRGYGRSYQRGRFARGYGSKGIWIPGRYEKSAYRVFVPERFEKVWVPPVYETRRGRGGRVVKVLVCEGHYKEICHPAHYVTRYKMIWVPGHYKSAPLARY